MFRDKGLAVEILTLDKIVEEAVSNDLVILKSIWGYHKDSDKFLHQLSILKNRSIRLVNDFPFIHWNIDKSSYLSEINFINIIPTQTINLSHYSTTQEIKTAIENKVSEADGDLFIIKPSISASGFLTFLYKKNSNDGDLFSTFLNNKNLNFLIQPFRPQIKEGEISIITIHGKLLYGIRRFPGVVSPSQNPEYLDIESIPRDIMETVENLLGFLKNKFGSFPLTSRIDFVKNESMYELMEIELIDPDLFFKYVPQNILEKSLSELYLNI